MTIIQLLAVILIGGPTVMLGVFLLARALVYNDGRGAYARDYLRRYREQNGAAYEVAYAKPARRLAPAPRRRPVAAVTNTPHTDTRWSTVGGGR